LLEPGERKSIQTDRVILVPGPDEELDIVRGIYRDFVDQDLTESVIAQRLNEQGVLTDMQRAWTRGTVHQVLTNEKYVGTNIYAKRSGKLKQPSHPNPPEKWVRCDGAFEAIVSREAFLEVRRRIALRSEKLSDIQMLDLLRKLLEKTGELSGLIIDEEEDMPSSAAYQHRFGGLVRAYRLISYDPGRDFDYLDINRQLRAWRPEVIDGVVAALKAVNGKVERHPTTDLLLVNNEWTLSVVLARCTERPDGSMRWRIHFDSVLRPDLTLACRLDISHAAVHDYYLIPRLDLGMWPRHLGFENSPLIDGYRQESLDALGRLAARVRYPEAA
jgi:hypothetical protein